MSRGKRRSKFGKTQFDGDQGKFQKVFEQDSYRSSNVMNMCYCIPYHMILYLFLTIEPVQYSTHDTHHEVRSFLKSSPCETQTRSSPGSDSSR